MLSKTLRVLIAAFVLAGASLGGAAFFARDRANHPILTLSDNSPFASVDLHTILSSGHGGDQAMVDSAFRQVEKAYYKPVDAQTLMTGERRELLAILKKKKVASPSIPAIVATGDESHDLAALNSDLAIAQQRYGSAATRTELTQAAMRGMLSSLGDPYTTYLSPHEIDALEESLKGGNFGGIGVYISQDPRSRAIVVLPIEGMPAASAGMRPGDRIVSVEGHPVAPLKLDDVEGLLRGEVGTTVHVVVRSMRATTDHALAIERRKIVVPSVHAERKDGFEYVRLADFGSTSYDEVRKAMLDGKAHGVKGYILDLRDNGGGYLDAAVSISSLFIDSGTVVSTIDRAGVRDVKSVDTSSNAFVGATPLVILVNKYTASASEITAGAVQDYKVGTLIGTKTFGKGVVQSIYNTLDGGALKITTARYVTPLGRDIQHKGIKPDIVVDQPADLPIIGTVHDKQFAAAENFLRHSAK